MAWVGDVCHTLDASVAVSCGVGRMNVATLSTNSNDLSQSLGSGWREELSFGDRLWLSLDHYRLAHHFRAQVHGLDMIKFHVRLSGRRLLGFAGAELVTLDTAATAVLLHETDQPKTDHG